MEKPGSFHSRSTYSMLGEILYMPLVPTYNIICWLVLTLDRWGGGGKGPPVRVVKSKNPISRVLGFWVGFAQVFAIFAILQPNSSVDGSDRHCMFP